MIPARVTVCGSIVPLTEGEVLQRAELRQAAQSYCRRYISGSAICFCLKGQDANQRIDMESRLQLISAAG